jgi:hypothetical protein
MAAATFFHKENDLPQLCLGEFNETIHSHEQIGGNERQEWSMEGFRKIVDYCGFTDLATLACHILGITNDKV